jgi:alanine-glyoxylate transaminase/serine-glyoxylate transaminase/serine-pyruvate transaminase
MARPTVGHLDPQFLEVMDEVADKLRLVFGTGNAMTFPVSGTGSSGMEAALANVLEPGDTAVVGVNGVFGTRIA